MISVIVKIDPRMDGPGSTKLHEIYAWLGTYVVDNWTLTTLTLDKIKVDFWGIKQEQEILAFKLKFGGIGGHNG